MTRLFHIRPCGLFKCGGRKFPFLPEPPSPETVKAARHGSRQGRAAGPEPRTGCKASEHGEDPPLAGVLLCCQVSNQAKSGGEDVRERFPFPSGEPERTCTVSGHKVPARGIADPPLGGCNFRLPEGQPDFRVKLSYRVSGSRIHEKCEKLSTDSVVLYELYKVLVSYAPKRSCLSPEIVKIIQRFSTVFGSQRGEDRFPEGRVFGSQRGEDWFPEGRIHRRGSQVCVNSHRFPERRTRIPCMGS